MSLREPCPHGRWEKHPDGSNLGWWYCPGGRILTDAEALRTLLYDECEKCKDGWVRPASELDDPLYVERCPACAGSGRTPKDGVYVHDDPESVRNGEAGVFIYAYFLASMLEGESK
jgi:hypothetical protein